ncbi:BREX-1 system adenine-specific DNA-methyltransferase PglX [Lactococcus formosensis]|nr:BREX-1 system adenine-specific DNA-methyltransferase PglX [Lactococcus formosensis]
MGSGHILVYAFDVFMQLYEAEGETPRTAAELILEKNLFGLDIDKRAFQLSYFSLMMKGRQHSRRILSKDIHPNVYVIPTQSGISEAELQFLNLDFPNPEKAKEDLLALSEGFSHGSDLGSLIEFKGIDFENLRTGLQAENNISFLDQAVSEMVQVGELLQQKYHIGITNPPYMGSSGMNKTLSDYVKKSYPDSKSDMFGIFIERMQKMTDYSGYYAMITQHAWMFLSSFEKLRKKLNQQTIINMIHLGTRAFEEIGGEVVQTTAFVMSPTQQKGFSGKYLRLIDFANHELKEEKTLEAIVSDSVDYLYNTVQDNFAKIPGSPISYWVSENLIQVFKNSTIGDSYEATTGLQTSDNNRFVRYWWEPQNCKISFCSKDNSDSVNSKQRWFPYNKGGGYRKWYGNNWHVLNWKNDGEDVREYNDYLNSNRASNIGIGSVNFFFKENISWSKITSSKFSSTWQPSGYIFDVAASSMFGENLTLPLSLLNSIVAEEILKIFNPTLNFQVGNINKVPLIINSTVTKLTVNNIELSKSDWDSFQVSWDFKKHPLI